MTLRTRSQRPFRRVAGGLGGDTESADEQRSGGFRCDAVSTSSALPLQSPRSPGGSAGLCPSCRTERASSAMSPHGVVRTTALRGRRQGASASCLSRLCSDDAGGGIRRRRAWLFGSAARQKCHGSSDVLVVALDDKADAHLVVRAEEALWLGRKRCVMR